MTSSPWDTYSAMAVFDIVFAITRKWQREVVGKAQICFTEQHRLGFKPLRNRIGVLVTENKKRKRNKSSENGQIKLTKMIKTQTNGHLTTRDYDWQFYWWKVDR